MGKYRIQFSLNERQNRLDDTRLENIIELIKQKPFGDYDRMALDLDSFAEDDTAFDEVGLITHLRQNEEARVTLRSGERRDSIEGELEIMLVKTAQENRFRILIDQDDFVEQDGVSRLYGIIRQMATVFDKLETGYAGASINLPDYYRELGLKKVSRCFGMFINWLHLMSEETYARYYKKQTLLAAPAYLVEEWGNNVIMLMNYKDPFSYDTAAVKQKVIELTNYFRENSLIKPVVVKK